MKRKWWVLLAALGGLATGWWFLVGGSSRIIRDYEFDRVGIVGVAPDGRLAAFGMGGLVLMDGRGDAEVRPYSGPEAWGGTARGTNGILVGTGRPTTGVAMLDWNGRQIWIHERTEFVGPRAVDQRGNSHFYGTNNVLHSLDPAGALRWSFSHPSAVAGFQNSPPVLSPDGRVAVLGGSPGGLIVLDDGGRELWSKPELATERHNSEAAFADNGDLVVRDGWGLFRIDRDGNIIWEVSLAPDPAQSSDKLLGAGAPVIGREGTIFIHLVKWVVAVSADAKIRWRHRLSDMAEWSGPSSNGAILTPAGSLVVIAAEREVMLNGAGAGPGNVVMLARDERMVCLTPDGELKWEQALPSETSWAFPRSWWDARVAWASRMGLLNSKRLGNLTTTPDGTIYVSGSINGKTRIWAIRGE